jgi:ABC-type transport system involved in multi-copper enzyme maturation permease subunit
VRPFGLIGPLAGWELRRLARRGAVLRVRLLFLYGLLIALAVFAALWFQPIPVRDVFTGRLPRFTQAQEVEFAGAFVLTIFEVQLAVVVAFTPALAASAVSEEKDRHTLQLLLTTQLTDREIVFGKAAGRIAFVLATVFSGVPVLAITMLFGGVDARVLAAGYALTAGTVALCAAIGVHAACRAPNLRSAVPRAYAATAVLVCGAFVPPLVFASPFALLAVVHRGAGEWAPAVGIGYPLAQLVVAGLFLIAAARALRLREPSAGPPPVTAFPEPPRPADPPLLRSDDESRPDLPPVDEADPVLWKERCIGRRPAWGVPTVAWGVSALAAGLAAVLFVAGGWVLAQRVALVLHPERGAELADRPGAPDSGGWLLVCAGVFAAGRYLLPLAVGVSDAIAGERLRGTLDALLATPLDRRALLRTKVRAAAERGSVFAAVAVMAVGMAFTADGSVWLGASAAVLMLCGFGLVIGAGAWLTVRCPSDTRALRLLLLVPLLVGALPAIMWNLLPTGPEVVVPPELLAPALLVVSGACGAAGLVLWWLAGRALERGE